jgi:hypothetical protein
MYIIIPEIILNNYEIDFVNDTSFLGVILDEQSTYGNNTINTWQCWNILSLLIRVRRSEEDKERGGGCSIAFVTKFFYKIFSRHVVIFIYLFIYLLSLQPYIK